MQNKDKKQKQKDITNIINKEKQSNQKERQRSRSRQKQYRNKQIKQQNLIKEKEQINQQNNQQSQQSYPDEQIMMNVLGFKSFASSKNKDHTNSAVQGVLKNSSVQRKYRQYMNRKGNFNRKLDAM